MTRPVARWVSAVGIATTVALAIGAFTLSFTALSALAVTARIREHLSWIWPLLVDGLMVDATVAVVVLKGRREQWYAWLLLIGGAVVSIAANAYHATMPAGAAMPPGLAAAVSSVPPVVLLAATHLTVILTRRPENTKVKADADAPVIVTAPMPTADSTRERTSLHSVERHEDGTEQATVPPSTARRPDSGTASVFARQSTSTKVGTPASRTNVVTAQEFIAEYLARRGGTAPAADVIGAARAAGYGDNQIKKARARCTPPVTSTLGRSGARVWALATVLVADAEMAADTVTGEAHPTAESHPAPPLDAAN